VYCSGEIISDYWSELEPQFLPKGKQKSQKVITIDVEDKMMWGHEPKDLSGP
jgi:hypothetical protein